MLSNLRRVIIRPSKGSSLRPAIQIGVHYLKRIAPVTPPLTLRALSVQVPRCANLVESNKIQPLTTKTLENSTPQSLLDTLEECKKTGKMMNAIKTVQAAQELGLATPELYRHLIEILRSLPFDIQECAVVAEWFYQSKSGLPEEVLNDLEMWKHVLKLGFKLGSTFRSEDLHRLVTRFTEIFDLTAVEDEAIWGLLIRAYGIIHKSDNLDVCFARIENSGKDKAMLYSSALLSYAAVNSHENVKKILERLKEHNLLSYPTLLKLIRCYGFNGDVMHTSEYMKMCSSLYPDEKCGKIMLLIAHKVALERIGRRLEWVRGTRGLSLKPADTPELDQLHASWTKLSQTMLDDTENPLDTFDCNVILQYLTVANRIDPIQFPMEKAEMIFDTYMPAHSIKPNETTYLTMLKGYSTSQQYKDIQRNTRLNKSLEVVSRMQDDGINTLKHSTFHALFHACLPHRNGHYYFDNFRLSSLLPARPYTHNRLNIDSRLFEIEKIMLEGKLPHDRFTFTTMLTCLASSGHFRAFRKRWNAIKLYGLHRDVGLYRLVFALSSLNPNEANHAISVVRHEMRREISRTRMDWDTYTAMLDCCVTAQLSNEAKSIIRDMLRNRETIVSTRTHAYDLSKWRFRDEPDYYLPMLRASILLPHLNADKIIKEIDRKKVPYSQGIWEAILSKLALENDGEGIRQLFNRYTMHRFENEGKIPVPAREASSPAIPFPTAPYNALDMKFIDVYVSSLVDSQDLSLVFDILRTLNEQTSKIGISNRVLKGVTHLAMREKSTDELKWLKEEILPKVPHQNKVLKMLSKTIDYYLT
ncbi:MAG: hypothetical protein EXX96DRAFT_654122 [Benjaminiella poitrasii]|nr:MAG: hypothetical protein EXX96DRAFT_654122 [Benjaminiella poitrasii]